MQKFGDRQPIEVDEQSPRPAEENLQKQASRDEIVNEEPVE